LTKFNLNDHTPATDSYVYHSLLEAPLDLEALGLNLWVNPALLSLHDDSNLNVSLFIQVTSHLKGDKPTNQSEIFL